MENLRIVTPTTVEEAVAILEEDGAVPIAGGTSLGIMMRSDLLDVDTLVNLAKLGLGGIRVEEGCIVIGGTTRLVDVARSSETASRCPALKEAAASVGNTRVRAVATIGGAMVHADPRQDVPPALLAHGGTVTLASSTGVREVPLSDFFLGFLETACREDELVTEVTVDTGQGHSAYARFNPSSKEDYPVVSAAAFLEFDADGHISNARVAVGGAGSRPFLVGQAFALLEGRKPTTEGWSRVAHEAMEASDPTTDHRGTADYKRRIVGVMTGRALAQACQDQL